MSQFTGCAETKPPLGLLDDAGHRVSAARSDGAQTYAPLELRGAEERLGFARTAMKAQEYEDATRYAAEAGIAADLAQARARLGKARERVAARSRENAQLKVDLSVEPDVQQGGGQ
ncbi:MAG: DUF4398 domain-containing protein [Rudaea sp.]